MERGAYKFRRHQSSGSERDELAATVREITAAAKLIAEELKRTSLIRTARTMARRKRRGSDS